MRTRNLIFLVVTAILLGMTACGKEPNYVPDRGLAFEIIKFEKAECKEYIMVLSPRDKMTENNKTGMWPSGPALPDSVLKAHGLSLYGQSPYIELPDDYLLIDWRWGRIYYPNNEAIINETWSEFHSYDTKWTLDKIKEDRPVAEHYYIFPIKLHEYDNKFKYDEILYPPYCSSLEEWHKFDPDLKDNFIKRMTDINVAFVEGKEVLSNLILEGKLKDYAKKDELRKK